MKRKRRRKRRRKEKGRRRRSFHASVWKAFCFCAEAEKWKMWMIDITLPAKGYKTGLRDKQRDLPKNLYQPMSTNKVAQGRKGFATTATSQRIQTGLREKERGLPKYHWQSMSTNRVARGGKKSCHYSPKDANRAAIGEETYQTTFISQKNTNCVGWKRKGLATSSKRIQTGLRLMKNEKYDKGSLV